MKTLDFGRSFVTFVTHGRGNNARIQVECRCRLSERNKASHDYLLVASCKSEDTFAEDDLFYRENYDFCGIFHERDYTIIRTHSRVGPGGKETGLVSDRFEDVLLHLTDAEGRECKHDGEVVQASLQGQPLVGVTEVFDPETGRKAVLEYPIKTMNANDIDDLWQVDTGPVVFPDFASSAERRIDWLELAFIALNRRDRAEFILQAPTLVACEDGGEVVVSHYSDIRKVEATSRILAL